MTGRGTDPSSHGIAQGDAAQMEQIRQSLVAVATDAADKAAQRTVERLFVGLGVDVSKPENIIELQNTLKFAASLHSASQTVGKTSLGAAVTLLTAAVFGVLALGLKGWLHVP